MQNPLKLIQNGTNTLEVDNLKSITATFIITHHEDIQHFVYI